jgi:uncharacterized protein (DUF983 family)
MELSTLAFVIVGLVILGVALYLIDQLPMEPWVKVLIRVVVILFLLLLLVRLALPYLSRL